MFRTFPHLLPVQAGPTSGRHASQPGVCFNTNNQTIYDAPGNTAKVPGYGHHRGHHNLWIPWTTPWIPRSWTPLMDTTNQAQPNHKQAYPDTQPGQPDSRRAQRISQCATHRTSPYPQRSMSDSTTRSKNRRKPDVQQHQPLETGDEMHP